MIGGSQLDDAACSAGSMPSSRMMLKGKNWAKGFFQGGKARAISDVCVCVREYVYVCVYSSHEESAPF